jgi:hypothetical protein
VHNVYTGTGKFTKSTLSQDYQLRSWGLPGGMGGDGILIYNLTEADSMLIVTIIRHPEPSEESALHCFMFIVV